MIAIIGGCGANIASVQLAIERLGKKSIYTTDSAVIQTASHVILPGVGVAGEAMRQFKRLQLVDVIRSLQQPVLGICIGMQILYDYSTEDETPCLGIIPGRIEILPQAAGFPIPHMGWNRLQ
jgi:glutamine amidotransferase